MVELDAANALQLLFLLCAVPLQYYLTTNSSESDRQFELKGMLTSVESFRLNALNATYWRVMCTSALEWLDDVSMMNLMAREEEKERMSSIPTEAKTKVAHSDYYAGSQLPRSPRPPHVTYRIGQVFTHKRWGYRGVIIGWDETAKAGKAWLDKAHPKDKPHWRTLPNYAALIDVRDRLIPQLDYVPQEQIVLVKETTRVMHPNLDLYFEAHEGKTYRARPRLQLVYPHD